MNKIIDFLDAVSEWTGRFVSWLSLGIVIVTFFVVVVSYLIQHRYIDLDINMVFIQESVIYMHALIFMIGASYTLKHRGHVRVDIIYRKLSEKHRALVDLIGSFLLLAPVCIFVFYISYEYVANSWKVLEDSQEAGGIPAVFLLKTVILITVILLLLQGVAEMLRNWQSFRKSNV